MIARISLKPKVERVKLKDRHPKPPPGIYSKAKQCKHCKHWYINPCTDQDACLNYQHIQKQARRKK